MGDYVYKVTSKTVDLEGGLKANIAVFAYKPFLSYFGRGPSNEQMHVRSGAAACDRAADAGKRTGWVVLGYERDEGGYVVNDTAYQIGDRGSFSDGWLDVCISKGRFPAQPVLGAKNVEIAA